jgi:hypothetical protein
MDLNSLMADIASDLENAREPITLDSENVPLQGVSRSKQVQVSDLGSPEMVDTASSDALVLRSSAGQPPNDCHFSNSPSRTISLNIDYKELAIVLRTEQPMVAELCRLEAENAVLREQLTDANRSLDGAHRTIGFLEAQVLLQAEQIRQLRGCDSHKTEA